MTPALHCGPGCLPKVEEKGAGGFPWPVGGVVLSAAGSQLLLFIVSPDFPVQNAEECVRRPCRLRVPFCGHGGQGDRPSLPLRGPGKQA